MPASSLLSTARRASITDLGDAPYEIVRPILMKLDNPKQLRIIEKASPQIIGHDAEIWLEFVKRDVPGYENKPYEPENPKNWHKVYRKLVDDSRDEIRRQHEELKTTLEGIKSEKSKHKLKQVELDGVKGTEGFQKVGPTLKLGYKLRFIDRGTQHGPPPSQRQLKIERGEVDPNAPRRTLTPKGKLDQFRKEAKAMGHFQQKPKQPPGFISAREMALKPKPTNTTIVKAPIAMIQEHRKTASPMPIDPTTIKTAVPLFTPKKRKIEYDNDQQPNASVTQEREKRLKAFTNPSSALKATPTIRVPSSRMSTPAASSASASQSPSPSSTQSLPTKKEVAFSKSSQSNPAARECPAPGNRIPRANTSSPNNEGTRPPMKRKNKIVDVFMKPNKKPRVP